MDELSGHLTEVGGAAGDEERNEEEGNDVELVRPCMCRGGTHRLGGVHGGGTHRLGGVHGGGTHRLGGVHGGGTHRLGGVHGGGTHRLGGVHGGGTHRLGGVHGGGTHRLGGVHGGGTHRLGGVQGGRWRAEHMGGGALYVPASPHMMWCRMISLQLEEDFQTFPVGAKEGTVEEEDTVNVSEDC